MPRNLATCLTLLALAAPAFAQDVAYQKHTLKNGMTVILHEDHRLPVVNINTWYYVGAKDEPDGRSGFAHLFEHLMFMGTERVPGSQFDLLMEGGGGANNASTDFDRTNYYSWGPAELLPTLLWLDADRMEDLGRMMTSEKLDLQRSIVRNERRQTTENVPYGRSQVKLIDMLFPTWHPYHDGVIGSHADLEAATVDDVKEFFANFYVPNNASLVVAGDFDPKIVMPMIEEMFGTLPRGADPVHGEVERPKLKGDLRCTMLDKVPLPMIRFASVSPDKYAPGDAEMEIIADLLTKEKSGRLYKRLVMEEGLAVRVSAAQESLMLGSIFGLDVVAKPGADLDRIEQIVDEETERLWKDGPTKEELQQYNISYELSMLSRLENLRWKADKLNEYQFHLGEPNSFKQDLDRFLAVTPKDLRVWRALPPGQRVIVRVLPEEPARVPTARDSQPANLDQGTFSPVAPETFELANQIPVSLFPRHDLPRVELAMLVETNGDTVVDPADQAGCGSLMAQMLSEGAGDLDAVQFADAMERLGANFGASADRQSFVVSLSALRRNFEPALELFRDAVLSPRFDTTAWERVKSLHLERLKQMSSRPAIVASLVGSKVFFGDLHPYGRSTSGTIESVSEIDLEDAADLFKSLLSTSNVRFVIAGDLTAKDAKRMLDGAFAKAFPTGDGGGHKADWTAAAHDGLRVVLVDRPGAVQTVARFVLPGIVRGDEKEVPYRLIGTVLGGTFTSRLNSNLREDKGYTYGASCRYTMDPKCGYFVASSEVRADVTGAALTEFLKEFAGLRGGDLSGADLQKARGAVRTSAIQSFAGLSGTVGQTVALYEAGLPFDSIAKDLAALNEVKIDAANAMTRDAVPLEKGVLVLVGDVATVREQIKDLGLPEPVELTVDGVPK